MSGAAAIRFDRVDKHFQAFSSPLDRLRELFMPSARRHTRLPVLHDLTMVIPRGQTLAIIGANGVGKSTTLHLIAGLVEPSAGTVTTNGRVNAVLDAGGYLLHDLSGRDNARFYHEIIGRSGADLEAFDAAVERFAAIGDYYDRPVRTYSTGMVLRLAFACATAEDPDILLLDEVLAVGDARFQQKCYRRVRELRDRGTTIVLVTHLVHGLAGFCDRVLVLENGRLAFDGDPATGVERYYQLFFAAPSRQPDALDRGSRYGAGGAAIIDPFTTRDSVHPHDLFEAGDPVRVVFDVEFARDVAAPQVGFSCGTKEGLRVYATTTGMLGETPDPAVAGERRRVEVQFRLDVAFVDLFVDLSVFEVVHGEVVVLDARLSVLHLTVTPPRHWSGLSDLTAAIRVVRS